MGTITRTFTINVNSRLMLPGYGGDAALMMGGDE
jgi:hypothetical protein